MGAWKNRWEAGQQMEAWEKRWEPGATDDGRLGQQMGAWGTDGSRGKRWEPGATNGSLGQQMGAWGNRRPRPQMEASGNRWTPGTTDGGNRWEPAATDGSLIFLVRGASARRSWIFWCLHVQIIVFSTAFNVEIGLRFLPARPPNRPIFDFSFFATFACFPKRSELFDFAPDCFMSKRSEQNP